MKYLSTALALLLICAVSIAILGCGAQSEQPAPQGTTPPSESGSPYDELDRGLLDREMLAHLEAGLSLEETFFRLHMLPEPGAFFSFEVYSYQMPHAWWKLSDGALLLVMAAENAQQSNAVYSAMTWEWDGEIYIPGEQLLYDTQLAPQNPPVEKPEELTDQQWQQLCALRAEGAQLYGFYPYQEMLITGQIDGTAPKLTLQNVRDILARYDGNSDEAKVNAWKWIIPAIEDIQEYPDFVGGTGTSLSRYFINGDPNEYISIQNKNSADGTIKYINKTTGTVEVLF